MTKNGHWAPRSFSACAPNTNTLDKDSQNLAALLDAYAAVYPDAHFELVGHSLGGVVALQGATDYVRHNGRAIITKVITLDSPLHGRGGGQAAGSFVVSRTLNIAGKCSAKTPDTELGQTLNAMAQGTGNLAETETAILASHGVEVYTLGNLDDCLYQQGVCLTVASALILGLNSVSTNVLQAIPDETSTQFIDGAYQRQYHLGQNGTWPGGHGAILSDPQSVPDIVWLLVHAPSATLYATVSNTAAPQLHVFVTGPERGVQAVNVQVMSSSGSLAQQFSLDGGGVGAYTDTLTLDPNKIGEGILAAVITSVTDNQNLEHLPQTASDGTESIRHDFIASVTFTNTYQRSGNGASTSTPTPTPTPSTLVLTSSKGIIYALDSATGHEKWHFDASGGSQWAPQVVGQYGEIVVALKPGTDYNNFAVIGTLYGFDAQTGHVRWSLPGVSVFASDANAIIVEDFLNNSGDISRIDPRSGSRLWSVSPAGFPWIGLVSGNLVLTMNTIDPNQPFRLFAFSLTNGAHLWDASLTSQESGHAGVGEIYVSPDSPQIVYATSGDISNGTVCGEHLDAFDASTGNHLWAYSCSNVQFVGTTDNRVLLSSLDTSQSFVAIALDALTGNEAWSFSGPPLGCNIMPFLLASQAYIPCLNDYAGAGTLFALNVIDGSVAWRQSTPLFAGPPLGVSGVQEVVNNIAYYEAYLSSPDTYQLVALNSATGAILWSYDGAFITTTNSSVIVCQNDGSAMALDLAGGHPLWSTSFFVSDSTFCPNKLQA